jgi:hypothetical protein
VHDAKEMAGCFYENDRSEVFRTTWPDQMDYVNAKWAHFVEPVRQAYAELLAHPGVPEDQKERMYEALTDQIEATVSDGAHSPLPIFKDSENFVGDRRENRKIIDTIGRGPRSLAAKLRTTTALSLIPQIR